MKIVLYLMNEKGKKVLEKLYEYFPHIIKAVVSSRDENMKDDMYDEIQQYCQNRKIFFLNRKDDSNQFSSYYRIAIGWRWLLKDEKKLIVIHDSLLPRYRGFSPLVNALINEEKKIGATALFANKDFDKGKIILQKEILISYPIKIQDAIYLMANIYQELVVEVVQMLLENKINALEQDETRATYSIWRDELDYYIDWNNSAEYIVRFINSLGYPYSGAYSFIDEKKVRLLEATVYENYPQELRHVGKVLMVDNGSPIIIAKEGLVKIEKLTDDNGRNLLPLKKFRIRFQ